MFINTTTLQTRNVRLEHLQIHVTINIFNNLGGQELIHITTFQGTKGRLDCPPLAVSHVHFDTFGGIVF